MRRAATITLVALLGGLPFIGTGCIPQDRYDQALLANQTLKEQLVRAEADRDAAANNLRAAQSELNATQGKLDDLAGRNDQLKADLDELTADYDDLLRQVASLEMGPLPPEVESALAALAATYPDLLTFDAGLGMLRFASDLTFDSGKDTLKPEATETVNAVAQILKAPAAEGFEVRVIGHTDNVPIQYSRANHPTNMHLAVHRAISVSMALVSAGVESMRIQAAGYGEYRPLVPNRAGGTPENRRVEIFLVPMPDLTVPMGEAGAGEAETAGATTETEDSYEPMK
ncbi:MAG: OmpA family protein [Phycisphaerales bacterium]|nr:MAG: OmpA family protein [Phycisphaerales bacterium]